MNSERQPPIDYIARTRERYDALGHPVYRWVECEEPPPWTPLRRPPGESRLALVASGGVYAAGQVAFHHRDDLGIRAIDRGDQRFSALVIIHIDKTPHIAAKKLHRIAVYSSGGIVQRVVNRSRTGNWFGHCTCPLDHPQPVWNFKLLYFLNHDHNS